ncbi:LuxR C-terminal-related transcriptional regulator [Nocardioides sp. MAHUQ-72]|uniref:LuxR C-terminal-related transcriptional regulator n=1 Tax=unclassified Nocardioides TaxID=2615069 RepID=UPI003607EB57
MAPDQSPIRIAVNDDYELVVAGVAVMLAPYAERVEVVELDSNAQTVSDVDIVLYDTFGQEQGGHIDVGRLTRDGRPKVVVFTWNLQRELVEGAISAGAVGYLWKGMPAAEMVAALEAVHAGKVVTPPEDAQSNPDVGGWPGRDLGLSAREAEVFALLTQGLTNQEIADRVYLSINTVKTHLKTAYRKIGISRRSQAVAWGLEHGFAPDRVRILDPQVDELP